MAYVYSTDGGTDPFCAKTTSNDCNEYWKYAKLVTDEEYKREVNKQRRERLHSTLTEKDTTGEMIAKSTVSILAIITTFICAILLIPVNTGVGMAVIVSGIVQVAIRATIVLTKMGM